MKRTLTTAAVVLLLATSTYAEPTSSATQDLGQKLARLKTSGDVQGVIPELELATSIGPMLVGDELRLNMVTTGWLEPSTLFNEDTHPRWVSASRAQLVIDHLFLNTRGDRPPLRENIPDKYRDRFEQLDVATQMRINRIVSEGAYQESWDALAPVFWNFYDELSVRVKAYEATHSPRSWNDEADDLGLVQLEKEYQLLHRIAALDIRDMHVIHEMVRRLDVMRAAMGMDSGTPRPLLYTCGSGEVAAVQINEKHPLASKLVAVYSNYMNHDSDSRDATAEGELLALLKHTRTELRQFAISNPEATTPALNQFVERISAETFVTKLAAYVP